MAHVSWQCEQSNPDIRVSGYKVLIDGKQYGNAMHEGIKTVRIKVGCMNPFIPSVPFFGPMQTVSTQIRRRRIK